MKSPNRPARGVAPITSLNPAKYNPRTISPEALKGLGASIDRFGLVQEIVVNRRGGANTVVGGHQRLKILAERGVTDAPVCWVDLDDIDEKALNVALNSNAIAGDFDAEALEAILAEIKGADDGLFEALRLGELEPAKAIADDKDDIAALSYATKFEVIVTCRDEIEQEAVFHELQDRGMQVRVMQL